MTYLNILWHFHQPWYLMPESNRISVSTITFRVLYNYYLMAKLIEDSGVRLTCNFTVPLLIQIQKIADGQFIDEFQEILKDETSNDVAKTKLFSREIPEKVKQKSPLLKALISKLNSDSISKKEISDLKIWLHLACFHPLMDEYFPEIGELKKKAVGFSQKDRELLISIEREIFLKTITLYKKLFETDKIELSITPGYHPILPLIYDISIAKKTKTSLKIPEIDFSYPEDVRAHIETGFATFEAIFEKKPLGFWPAEGSISNEICDVFSEHKILWIGADQQILNETNVSEKDCSKHIYRWKDSFSIFFRNHDFSDRIGFIYQSWDEEQAAMDLVKRIEDFSKGDSRILTIILDGENAWEWYQKEGSIFLKEFYSRFVSNENIKMVTMSQAAGLDFQKVVLDSIPPGSWMGLHFDNWIGSQDANRLWALLSNARKTVKQHNITPEKLKQLVLLAESSDFFWWMSVTSEQEIKLKFYSLFQAIVSAIYKEIGMIVPEEVLKEWSFETKVREPSRYITATIDGKLTNFFEWSGAAEISIEKLWATFQPFSHPVKKISYGYDTAYIYIRIDILEKNFKSVSVEDKKNGNVFFVEIGENISRDDFAIDSCIEIKIPLEKLSNGNEISFAITLKTQDTEIRIPPAGFLTFTKKIFEEDWE